MSPSSEISLASVDGAIMPASQATIPATDEGLLRGDGAFEVIRIYDGRPFALDEHLRRLARSAASLRLPVDVDSVRAELTRLLAATGAGPAHEQLRIVITRGGRRLLLTEPLHDAGETVRLASVTYCPTQILDGIKSLSYAANMLAGRIACERGFDEALLVTPHGHVLEAPTSSFFWVKDGNVRTPPLDEHILSSITRRVVIEVSDARECVCTLDDVGQADEVFLASTTREVQPVTAVDDFSFEVGPLARRLAGQVREHIRACLD